MKDLKNIKKALLEIGQLLAQNTTIAQLLYNDNSDALINPIPVPAGLDYLINEKYITVYPPVETAIENATKNTFLILLLDTVNLQTTDNNMRASITLYVTTDSTHILLEDNKNRLLELSDEIIRLLEQQKLTSAGEIAISSMSHVMLSQFRAGYRISLTLTDQISYKAEI